MNLTIAYITCRKEPHLEWFKQTLTREIQESGEGRYTELIVVTPYSHNSSREWRACAYWYELYAAPKPNVWQGKYRLTKEDWWAASNARNTALCLCNTEYIVYVDDLCILVPGWLDAVKEAMDGGYVVCGTYKKVKNLVVKNGEVSCDIASDDVRYNLAPDPVGACNGDWLYGCSCGFPTEDLLEVGGWPEWCDGLGGEDYCLGHILQNAGKTLKYDKRMLTLESEPDHYVETPLKRMDKGVSPKDKSHAALKIAKTTRFSANYFPKGGIRKVREDVLAGNPFPVIQEPKHDWWDGQPISEM